MGQMVDNRGRKIAQLYEVAEPLKALQYLVFAQMERHFIGTALEAGPLSLRKKVSRLPNWRHGTTN